MIYRMEWASVVYHRKLAVKCEFLIYSISTYASGAQPYGNGTKPINILERRAEQ